MDYFENEQAARHEMMHATYAACSSNNIRPIIEFMENKIFPKIPKKIKEQIIFEAAIVSSSVFSGVESEQKILEYLIFDYKIDESIIDDFDLKSFDISKAQEMFKIRRIGQLNSELEKELVPSDREQIKKIKI